MTTEGKRRAVYTVLAEFLEGDDLWSAMWRWQNQYAEKSQFELNAFLSECRDIPQISLNRPVLYRKLIGVLMNNSSTGLMPDPIKEMQAYLKRLEKAGGKSEDKPVSEDWAQTFTMVMRAIFSSIRSDTARSVKNYAAEQAGRNKMPQSFIYSFTLWDMDKKLDVGAVSVQDLRKLLNFIYIGLCEALGPVDADRILGSSIAEVSEAIAAGKQRYPDPRLLLRE